MCDARQTCCDCHSDHDGSKCQRKVWPFHLVGVSQGVSAIHHIGFLDGRRWGVVPHLEGLRPESSDAVADQ